jgi:membrane-bound lytic murein transglycosylase A
VAGCEPAVGPRGANATLNSSSPASLSFEDLSGFAEDGLLEAFRVFRRSCAAIAGKLTPLRPAVPAPPALRSIAREALVQEFFTVEDARRFFETHFRPWRVAGPDQAFLTGYYEPVVEGSLVRTENFTAPILARPDNLTSLAPCPDRAAIEAGALDAGTSPIVWLRDRAEVFFVQVQGSARVRFADGRMAPLIYAGRNGHPYTSIGRILIELGEISEAEMSLATLKQWIRAHGQSPGTAGFALMQRNKSYVFFRLGEADEASDGAIGGQGICLTALRSIAVDRSIWSYGLPFWLSANLPWQGRPPSPFRRLMIAQDTGSAITGRARCDIFFGPGDDAGARAGDIRHAGEVVVLLPAGQAPP